MEPIAEIFFISAYNKLGLSISKYSSWKDKYPNYFNASTATLLEKLKHDREYLKAVLQLLDGSKITERKRLCALKEIDFLLNELQPNNEGEVTIHQGLSLDNYLYKMIANRIAVIIYNNDYPHNSFERLKHSPFANADLTALVNTLKMMGKWLSESRNLNYVDFEYFMDQHLREIAEMSASALAA